MINPCAFIYVCGNKFPPFYTSINYFFNKDDPAIKAIKKRTINTKNNIFAIDAAPAAIPVNPNNAAIIATIKNMSAQRNMTVILN